MILTSKQIKFLKKQAHHLKPIFQVGKAGYTKEQAEAITLAVRKRELIKVSLLQNTPEDPASFAEQLTADTGLQVVQQIGRILVIFGEASQAKDRHLSQQLKEL